MKVQRSILASLGLMVATSIGVAAQEGDTSTQAPVEFTGRLTFGPQVVTGTETVVDGKTEVRGHVFQTPVAVMSDPRLDGIVTRTNNVDIYEDPPVWTWQATWRIETEEGAWQGTETPLVYSDGSRSTNTVILVGEGAYEGLIAITEFDHEGEAWDLRGAIVDGEMPPVPVPTAAD